MEKLENNVNPEKYGNYYTQYLIWGRQITLTE